MNDLIRPALYRANHKIESILASSEISEKYFVVGPVCETADSFGEFSISAKEHDHLIIYSVGAYGYSMASNYNSRLRASEYLVDGSKITEIRKAESYDDLIKLEQ
jgi:diaminopimelate decarboxylase